jgi:hypothetical protein
MPTDVRTISVTLPMGVWLGAEDVLKERRRQLRQWYVDHPGASDRERQRTRAEIAELTQAIDAITGATASID